jgi:predicted nucleic acid-binding protein
MIVVADASVLVAELMRERGWTFARDAMLQIAVAEEPWSETQHEIARRLRHISSRGWWPEARVVLVRSEIQKLIDENNIDVVAHHIYHHLEAKARRRIPRDPNDWPTVALALTLDAGILTADYDFLGCGCPTWSFETLRAELEASS